METIAILALILSLVLYILVGLRHRGMVKNLGDIIPVMKGTTAKVGTSSEFSASTVATTISLATVIVAFFDLVPGLGMWLFWPVITTALGLLFFGLIAKKIWTRMEAYDHRPSMHEFLGVEFSSKNVALVGAIFTTIGYLSMLAVELTIGSRFIAALIPAIPEWITVVVITFVAFFYTSLGGFRTVVVTDRFQMAFIWLLLAAILGYYAWHIPSTGGLSANLDLIPDSVKSISWNNGLVAFVIGIFLMNLFTYVSNMGLWQRVSGSQQPQVVIKGMWGSVAKSAVSWGLFVIVAVGAFMVVTPQEGENLLITLTKSLSSSNIGLTATFFIVLGLFGAMLSTASTQLIAVSHTIYEDIIAPFREEKLATRATSQKELQFSRRILVISAIGAIGIVEILRFGGFSVADLAFSIYGAALSLVPPILLALFTSRDYLKKLGLAAIIAIITGFAAGWGSAILGKVIENGNLVFLAPCISILVSSAIIGIGILVLRGR